MIQYKNECIVIEIESSLFDNNILKSTTIIETEVDVKYSDGLLLFDKLSSPQGDLNAIYKICEKMDDNIMILFVIKRLFHEKF